TRRQTGSYSFVSLHYLHSRAAFLQDSRDQVARHLGAWYKEGFAAQVAPSEAFQQTLGAILARHKVDLDSRLDEGGSGGGTDCADLQAPQVRHATTDGAQTAEEVAHAVHRSQQQELELTQPPDGRVQRLPRRRV